MSKPRNPRYFPKMKVRGARRRRMAPFHRTLRGIDLLTIAAQEAGMNIIEYHRSIRGN